MNAGGLADCCEDVEVMGLWEACRDSCLPEVFSKLAASGGSVPAGGMLECSCLLEAFLNADQLHEALRLREALLMQYDCRRPSCKRPS